MPRHIAIAHHVRARNSGLCAHRAGHDEREHGADCADRAFPMSGRVFLGSTACKWFHPSSPHRVQVFERG